MKQLLITIAAVVLVGCGESQQSDLSRETKTESVTISPNLTHEGILSLVKNCEIQLLLNFLNKGGNVNSKNELDETILHYAATRGCTEIVKLLISKGANINLKNEGGQTPLHIASLNEHYRMVELLVSNGANVNDITKGGNTALDMFPGGKASDFLRKHGAKTAEELKAAGN